MLAPPSPSPPSPLRGAAPDRAGAWRSAREAEDRGQPAEAVRLYRDLARQCQLWLADHPLAWEVHELKGHCEYKTGQFEKAWHSFRRARAHPPLAEPALLGQVKAGLEIGRYDDLGLVSSARFPEWVARGWISASTLLTLPVAKRGEDLRAAAVAEAAQRAAGAADPPPPAAPARGRRWRVGYLSPDFQNHAVAHQVVRVLECHDRSRFEVFAYRTGSDDGSTIARRLQAAVEVWRDCPALSAADLADRLRADRLDLLVDLAGHTFGNRLDALARRPAPVQACWLGYPGTTGSPAIDYFVADDHTCPPRHRAHFSEHRIGLPHSYLPADNRQPIAPETPARATFGLPEEAVVLAAFHPPYKMEPEVLEVWCRILARSPRTVLWVRARHELLQASLRQRLAAHGVDPARLVFDDILCEKPRYLAKLRLADLFLDTFHFSGHSTISDALWAGLPVISHPGETFAARVGSTLLRAAGRPDLVADSPAAYEDLVVALATDPARRADLTRELRQSIRQTPLFQTETWTRHLEQAWHEVCQRAADGHPPQDFSVA